MFLSFVTILIVLNFVESARILCIYPVPFNSHQSVFQILTKELSRQGHQLVVLTPLPLKENLENVTQIDVHDISYAMWDEGFNSNVQKQDSITMDPITFWRMVYTTVYPIVDAQFSVPEMQALIKDKTQHFDLILVEACIRASMLIYARFKAPIIAISSFYGSAENFYTVGAEINPIFFPDYNIQKIWHLSFWDKLTTLYTSARLRLMEWQIEEVENAMITKHFGEKSPTIQEIKKNVRMLLLNVHHVWDNNRPVPPSVIYMGAVHLKKPNKLPNELENYLDNSRHGVIYMSLGSKINSADLPPKSIRVIIDVFASLPYDIIWKWNGAELPGKPKNVRLEKWLPQNDLLHHSKIKAFITQGGLQSTDEAIAANVPLVGLPVFADQWMNVQKYEQHGIGVQLDIDTLTVVEFRKAILTVAEDRRYRDNIRRLSRIMVQQRTGALEKALQWIDFVATNDTIDLNSQLASLSFTEYYMLDIIIPLTLMIIFTLVFAVFVLRYFVITLRNIYNTRKKLKTQ